MGGYVKGIVTGLVSFVLGFAVLSVVMPVEPPEAPAPAASTAPESPTTTTAPAEMALEAPAAESPQDAVAPDATLDSAAPEAVDPEPAGSAEPVADPAAPVTEVSPPADDASETAPALTSASEPQAPAPTEPAPYPDAEEAEQPAAAPASEQVTAEPTPVEPASTPDAVRVEEASETAPEPAPLAEPQTPAPIEPAPGPDAAAVEEAEEPAAEALASERDATEPASFEPAPAADAALVEDVEPPAAIEAASEQVEDAPTPGASPDPAPALAAEDASGREATEDGATAGAVASTASDPAPELPLAPVPAPATPESEPLLTQPPAELPRVQPMPSGAPGVAVRRGGGEAPGRLPTIGSEPAAPAAEPEPAPAQPDADLPAVERFAAVPTLPEGMAPLGVVLTDLPETGSAAETAILAFPVPVTVVLDPYDSDAPRRARIYRAAGHEVALRASALPALARPSDLAVTLDAWQRAFPGVVAFVDVPINGLGANAQLAREFAGMLEPEGYGVIALRDGLDAFLQAGRAAGLAAAPVYRTLDDEEHSAITIRRLLDRAAFEALRQPGILVSGSAANPDTMAELADFARGQGRAGVALVPASAVLTRR